MPESNDPLLSKVQLIMDSPTERNKYMSLDSFDAKIAFIRNHFILKDMEIRLLERRYLLDTTGREALLNEVDAIINKLEN